MKIKNTIKLNTYNILADKIQEGIDWGWKHAHKYSDSPNENTIKEHIYNDIMNSLNEIINYED